MNKQYILEEIIPTAIANGGIPSFEDVLAACEAVAEEDKVRLDEGKATTEEIGFVYLLKAREFYKIGRSNSLGRRVREPAIQLPKKATTVHSIRSVYLEPSMLCSKCVLGIETSRKVSAPAIG